MNRRGFLKALTVAPVALPMAASAAAAQSAMPALFTPNAFRVMGFNFGGITWSDGGLVGKPITQWDRDSRAFYTGLNNLNSNISYAAKLPNFAQTVIEKTADFAVDQLTDLTEQKPQSVLAATPDETGGAA